MLVTNHLSYLDLPVLGACVQAQFVAEVSPNKWPVWRWMIQRLGTVFVDRNRKWDVVRVHPRLAERVRLGDGVILFPEGTGPRAERVEPFHPPLAAAASRNRFPVHHAAIRYRIPSRIPVLGTVGLLVGRHTVPPPSVWTVHTAGTSGSGPVSKHSDHRDLPEIHGSTTA